MERRTNLFSKILIYTFLTLVLIITVTPIIYTVSASFKTNSEILAHPENLFPIKPTLDNYRQAWTSDVFNVKRMFFNSCWYTAICVIVALLNSSMGGYVFARADFYGKKVFFVILSSLMFIGLGSIVVYPLFEILRIFGLHKSLWGLVVVKIFGIATVNIYLIKSYVATLPKELDEAAEIDGCGFVSIFFRIILPLLKPILATIGILSFNGSWNEYLMPTIFTMGRVEQRTLIVGVVTLKSSGEAAASWNLMLAGTTITLIPVLVAYAFGNKYFVSGLAAGAVKG